MNHAVPNRSMYYVSFFARLRKHVYNIDDDDDEWLKHDLSLSFVFQTPVCIMSSCFFHQCMLDNGSGMHGRRGTFFLGGL